jgi:hypothetical protein
LSGLTKNEFTDAEKNKASRNCYKCRGKRSVDWLQADNTATILLKNKPIIEVSFSAEYIDVLQLMACKYIHFTDRSSSD